MQIEITDDIKKPCTKCGKEKRLDEFAWNKSRGKRFKRTTCKRCCADYTKRCKTNPPPKRVKYTPEERHLKKQKWSRKAKLRQFYNLNEEQYQAMFEAQGGVCAICGKPETWENQYGLCSLSVDHDHETG